MTPQHYPVREGALYGGEYPGDKDPEIARLRIRYLVDRGIRTFIDLTSPHDCMEPYEGILTEVEQETGAPLRRISIPVPDMSVPDSGETMHTIINTIRDSIDSDPAVYVHCWGGIGRTGTAIGCWLRNGGLGADESLERVQELYSTYMSKWKVSKHPESPQTKAQKNYIRNWGGCQ